MVMGILLDTLPTAPVGYYTCFDMIAWPGLHNSHVLAWRGVDGSPVAEVFHLCDLRWVAPPGLAVSLFFFPFFNLPFHVVFLALQGNGSSCASQGFY